MNDKLVDVLLAHAEVSSAFEALAESEKNLQEVDGLMKGVESLVAEVQTFGYTEMTNDHIKSQKGLDDLVHLSADKIIQFKATEGLLQGAAEGFKKFVQAIKDFIKKVIVYLQQLFNTFGNKCRTLMMNLQNIDMNKKVQTLDVENWKKILIATKESRDFCQKHIRVSVSVNTYHIRCLADVRSSVKDMVTRSNGLFKSNSPYNISVDNSIFTFKEMTLTEAGWSLEDISGFISSYTEAKEHYTRIGAIFNRMMTEFDIIDIGVYGDKGKEVRGSLRLNAVVYGLLSKIQHIQVRQILAFYKCLGQDIKLAEGDDGKFSMKE